jgi:hypothetical protein
LKILPLAHSTTPLELWVVDRGEHCLRADGIAEFSEVLVVELLAVIDCQFG